MLDLFFKNHSPVKSFEKLPQAQHAIVCNVKARGALEIAYGKEEKLAP
jgi:hypothetical protein